MIARLALLILLMGFPLLPAGHAASTGDNGEASISQSLPPWAGGRHYAPEASSSRQRRMGLEYDVATGRERILTREYDVDQYPEAYGFVVSHPEPTPLEMEVPYGALAPEAYDAGSTFTKIEQPYLSDQYKTVVYIELEFSGGNSKCSGAIIDEFHVLTAGHCVYDRSQGWGWANSARVWPAMTDALNPTGFDYPDYPYGVAEAAGAKFRTYTGWADDGDYAHDWALITLDRNIGRRTGWMGEDSSESETALLVAGYPRESPTYVNNRFMYSDAGTATYDTYRVTVPVILYTGMSGGPGWANFGGDQRIVGVISTRPDTSNTPTYMCRLTSGKIADIIAWSSEDSKTAPPVAKSELIEYVQKLDRKGLLTVSGSEGDEVRVKYNVYNVGFADAGKVKVDFYLSVNRTINPAFDLYLDTHHFMSGAFPGNTFTTQTKSIYIPGGLLARPYYVGWHMTSGTEEYNTDNNIAVIADATLTVLAPGGSPISVQEALDNPKQIFKLGGDVNWFGQQIIHFVGGSALQTEGLEPGESSWFETDVTGEGEILFWWKTDVGPGDWMGFYIDDVLQKRKVTGVQDWIRQSFYVPPGAHSLKWMFEKGGDRDPGSPSAWVDNANYKDPPDTIYADPTGICGGFTPCEGLIQDTIDLHLATGAILRTAQEDFEESVTIDIPYWLVLECGWNAFFSEISGATGIERLALTAGTVTLKSGCLRIGR